MLPQHFRIADRQISAYHQKCDVKKKTRKKPSGKTKRPNPKTNPAWFQHQFALNNMSLRGVAKAIGTDHAALSRAIHGERVLRMDELVEIAKVLNMPVETLLPHAGIKGVGKALNRSKVALQVPVAGVVAGGELIIQWGVDQGPKNVSVPVELGSELKILRCVTSGTKFDALDGALIFFDDAEKTAPIELLGKLCVVKIKGLEEVRLRVLRKGYQRGAFNLLALSGEPMELDQQIDTAFPVCWMKF